MRYLFAAALLLLQSLACAAPVRVAVAANFAVPLRALVSAYRHDHPQADIQVTVASTGKLAAQIRQGAPFDLFLAADQRRPEELENEGLARAGSRQTYALGRLALWSRKANLDLGPELLNSGQLSPLALANARTAPYGVAAEAVIATLALPDSVTLVRGENVAQTFHFADSGAAQAAFVAYSQVLGQGGSLWLPPTRLYEPIIQQAVRLTDSPDAARFYRYLFSAPARESIRRAGYAVDGD
ncbi:molybdate ABC transporter substrate-binding protein [Alcanivorax sp. N3-2A]|nr:molybdate ABC transporter substrate-binding protein [Alcanivorax sp. N3-2A]|tara:strand:+ start:7203 stop:7925 length:723 start_codon:yes stop_codon:yes gene_type:complete